MHERFHEPEARPVTAAPAAPVVVPGTGRSAESRILALHRTHGNRFVQRAVEAGMSGGEVSAHLEERIDRERSGGAPLDSTTRTSMESAFGADFSPVRVHTGPEAHELNRQVSARAFTTGSDIFFADGQYAPASSAGRELVAHELTHVVQQAGGVRAKLEVSPAGDPYEREADEVARAVVQQESAEATTDTEAER